MNPKLKEKTVESLSAVLPITFIVLGISVLFVPLELNAVMLFLVGAVLLVIGMGFFQLGAEMAMTPLGEGIGMQISRTRKVGIILLVGFLMGFLITISEPDLQVLAEQVPAIPNSVLILTVAVGVGLFLALAILRIIFRISLSTLLMFLYAALLLLSFFTPTNFVAIAFDSGGVTTGPMTVPFIIAMGVGIASIRGDKDAASDSFGLVALSSVGPVVAVLLLGNFYAVNDTVYETASVTDVTTTRDVVITFGREFPAYIREVMISLLPIIAVMALFQLLTHRYKRRQVRRICIGFAYTYIGLVLFLCGVNVGFSPVGTLLGSRLAELEHNWILIPMGMAIGYYIVKAEPAIQVLNRQVESVTSGAVSAKSMNLCLSIGVAVSVGLAMLRVLTGISIYRIIIPGYVIALILSRLVPKIFVGIAFDSGGVASGPMTSTFLLPLSIGACEAIGGNLMTDAFGVVALVALTPLIAVQIMGLRYKWKLRRLATAVPAGGAAAEDDEILDLEGEDEDDRAENG